MTSTSSSQVPSESTAHSRTAASHESLACKSKNEGCYALITGASEGIGHQVACDLSKHNVHVFLTAKDESCAQAAKKHEEKGESGEGKGKCCMSFMELNVLKDDSIQHCADRLKNSGIQLNILICNAAVPSRSNAVTVNSAKEVLQVNYYGYLKTFECFRSHGLLANGCKVIFVSSNLGIMALQKSSKELVQRLLDPRMNVEELNGIAEQFISHVEQGEASVKAAGFAVFDHAESRWDYAFSKELILILTRILARKYEGKYFINAIHPGLVATELTQHTKEATHSVEEAAQPIVQLALATDNKTGCYYDRSECKCNLMSCTVDDVLSKPCHYGSTKE